MINIIFNNVKMSSTFVIAGRILCLDKKKMQAKKTENSKFFFVTKIYDRIENVDFLNLQTVT